MPTIIFSPNFSEREQRILNIGQQVQCASINVPVPHPPHGPTGKL